MMRCILFGADAVYLWVGETADGSELAFDLISTYDMAFEAHNTTSPDKDFAFLQLLLDPGHEAHWNGLTMMLQRQFWSQISTIQEIALARNAVLRCGKDSIPWVSARRFLKKCTAWTQYRVPPVVQLLAEMK